MRVPGLDPGINPRICRVKEDGRIKSGHDMVGMTTEKWNATVLIRHPDESQGPAFVLMMNNRKSDHSGISYL